LNIAVCVKHIPDPNLPGELDGERLKREGVQGVLDPGDEFGVEAGLQLKEAHGGEVTLVSMGPSRPCAGVCRWARTRACSSPTTPCGAPMR
jgi:electron transfer flavoprotein beta subunit